jgi:REP element-mobilizing transposase RayT
MNNTTGKDEKRSSGVPPQILNLGQDGQATLNKTPTDLPSAFDPNRPVDRRLGAFLPHWEQEGAAYFVTFRLGDSLPLELALQWWKEREVALSEVRNDVDAHRRTQNVFSKKMNTLLDNGHGACWLKRADAAEIVAKALRHFNEERYRLWAYSVMPNHVHVVFAPFERHALSPIMHSWKSFTAKAINRLVKRTGQLWQPEYFDHAIRSQQQFERCIAYTLSNQSPHVGVRRHPAVECSSGVPPEV